MKTKFEKGKTNFNFRVNSDDYKVVRKLKDEHGINLSGAFKVFLRKYLDVLEKNDKNIQI